jgi:glutathione synthase
MEVNVFSPGGLGSCEELYGENFAAAIIQDLERKMFIRRHATGDFTNASLATL